MKLNTKNVAEKPYWNWFLSNDSVFICLIQWWNVLWHILNHLWCWIK